MNGIILDQKVRTQTRALRVGELSKRNMVSYSAQRKAPHETPPLSSKLDVGLGDGEPGTCERPPIVWKEEVEVADELPDWPTPVSLLDCPTPFVALPEFLEECEWCEPPTPPPTAAAMIMMSTTTPIPIIPFLVRYHGTRFSTVS